MPRVGKKEFSYDEEGDAEAMAEASEMGQELKAIPLENIEPEIPTSNAVERSETYQLGGEVRSPATPSIKPPAYRKGGSVPKAGDPMSPGVRDLPKTPPKKGKGLAQSAKQKKEKELTSLMGRRNKARMIKRKRQA